MLVQPYERQAEGPLSSFLRQMEAGPNSPAAPAQDSTNASDSVARYQPPWFSGGEPGPGSSVLGEIGEILQELMQLLQRLAQGIPQGGNEQFFRSATASSSGDPHLSFNANHWDDMASQPNLLDSNSFPGGYRISTQVTPPDRNGVTYNESATVSTNYGRNCVSLDKSGSASVVCNGQAMPVAQGQTLTLGDGETVSRTATGLEIVSTNETGGRLTTTLVANGSGVDVQSSASNVDLGGALVRGNVPTSPWDPFSGYAP